MLPPAPRSCTWWFAAAASATHAKPKERNTPTAAHRRLTALVTKAMALDLVRVSAFFAIT
jgi:DNA repair protein RadC